MAKSSVPYEKLEVGWIPQIPMEAFRVPVESVEQAMFLLDVLADYDLFQLAKNIKPDYSNAGGLEGFYNGEWEEWESEDGESVDDLLRERKAVQS